MKHFAISITLLVLFSVAQAQKYIGYKVEYTNGSCKGYWPWPPKPVVVMVQSTAQLIQIMETASDMDKRYQFQADFDGDYHITTMNGRSNTENCTWLVYVTSPGELEVKSGSLWDSPRNKSQVTLRYTAYNPGPPGYVRISYRIEYDPSCSLRRGPRVYQTNNFVYVGSALQLMQFAINDCKNKVSYCNCDPENYIFMTTYCQGKGFKIDMIDNTPNDPRRLCYWTFYYVIPGHEDSPVKPNISPSRFVFGSNDYAVLMRYEQAKEKQTCDTMEGITESMRV